MVSANHVCGAGKIQIAWKGTVWWDDEATNSEKINPEKWFLWVNDTKSEGKKKYAKEKLGREEKYKWKNEIGNDCDIY